MSACAMEGASWKEEVLLHDGKKIIVERSQTYGGRHEIGQKPPIKEQKLTLPGSNRSITWKSESSEDVGRANLKLLALHVIPNIDYSRHNTDGSLNLYNPATGQGEMTDLYLADRAAMLTWKIRYDKGFRDDNDAVHVGGKPYFEVWNTGALNDAEWRIAA